MNYRNDEETGLYVVNKLPLKHQFEAVRQQQFNAADNYMSKVRKQPQNNNGSRKNHKSGSRPIIKE